MVLFTCRALSPFSEGYNDDNNYAEEEEMMFQAGAAAPASFSSKIGMDIPALRSHEASAMF